MNNIPTKKPQPVVQAPPPQYGHAEPALNPKVGVPSPAVGGVGVAPPSGTAPAQSLGQKNVAMPPGSTSGDFGMRGTQLVNEKRLGELQAEASKPESQQTSSASSAPVDPIEEYHKAQLLRAQHANTQPVIVNGAVVNDGNDYQRALNNHLAYQQHKAGLANSGAQAGYYQAEAASKNADASALTNPAAVATHLAAQGLPDQQVAQHIGTYYPQAQQGVGVMTPDSAQGFAGFSNSPQGAWTKQVYDPANPGVGSAMSPLDMRDRLRGMNLPGANDPNTPNGQALIHMYRQKFPGGVQQRNPDRSVLGSQGFGNFMENMQTPALQWLGDMFTSGDGLTTRRKQYQDSNDLQNFINSTLVQPR